MIQVWLTKYRLRSKRKNGQHHHRYQLRWQDDAGTWHSESTGTADRTEALYWQRQKYEELNGMREAPPVPKAVATWRECREALERATKADNLRPHTIKNYVQTLNKLRETFPDIAGPADITPQMASEYKVKRSEAGLSPHSIDGDLSTLHAVYKKWLVGHCKLVDANPFADVTPPKCDAPDVRIVSTAEAQDLFAWLDQRWNGWRLPRVYLRVAAYTGWRVSEVAALSTSDMQGDDVVVCRPENCKTRRPKTDLLPPELFAELKACAADGWAFGRFPDELRRRLLFKRQPNHAARVRDFSPARLVAWVQRELDRYHDEREATAHKAGEPWERFTLHDLRKTAITGMQEGGGTEKDVSRLVGATPEVIRKHYERMEQVQVARRLREIRLRSGGPATLSIGDNLCAPAANA